jgi:hypothetical protein
MLFTLSMANIPDPYGVLALEKEGLEIREAGTKTLAPRESFIFNPSPSSPVFKTFNRNSMDSRSMSQTVSRRSSWRTSMVSTATQTMDMATQTDFDKSDTPASRPHSITSSGHEKMTEIPEDTTPKPTQPRDLPPHTPEEAPKSTGVDVAAEKVDVEPFKLNHLREQLDADFDDEDHEEPAVVVHAIQHVTSPKFMSKARVVTVQKQLPPALPPRNPVRDRKRPLIITADNYVEGTESHDKGTSPMSNSQQSSAANADESDVERTISNESFSSVDLNGEKAEETEKLPHNEHEDKKEAIATAAPEPLPTAEPEKTMPGQF